MKYMLCCCITGFISSLIFMKCYLSSGRVGGKHLILSLLPWCLSIILPPIPPNRADTVGNKSSIFVSCLYVCVKNIQITDAILQFQIALLQLNDDSLTINNSILHKKLHLLKQINKTSTRDF